MTGNQKFKATSAEFILVRLLDFRKKQNHRCVTYILWEKIKFVNLLKLITNRLEIGLICRYIKVYLLE